MTYRKVTVIMHWLFTVWSNAQKPQPNALYNSTESFLNFMARFSLFTSLLTSQIIHKHALFHSKASKKDIEFTLVLDITQILCKEAII